MGARVRGVIKKQGCKTLKPNKRDFFSKKAIK
jgi:hypothetical protein